MSLWSILVITFCLHYIFTWIEAFLIESLRVYRSIKKQKELHYNQTTQFRYFWLTTAFNVGKVQDSMGADTLSMIMSTLFAVYYGVIFSSTVLLLIQWAFILRNYKLHLQMLRRGQHFFNKDKHHTCGSAKYIGDSMSLSSLHPSQKVF